VRGRHPVDGNRSVGSLPSQTQRSIERIACTYLRRFSEPAFSVDAVVWA